MFYKGELDGVLAVFIDDLPLMLAVDFGLGTGGACTYSWTDSSNIGQLTYQHPK
jgi:hypothetical protein